MSPSPQEPELLHYSNYRTYLSDYYDFQKSRRSAFSHRFFARKAGLSSPNYLKLVMDGKRNLSKKTLQKFAIALGLKGRKGEFFENLVFFNQATSSEERNLYYENILKTRARSGIKKLDEAQFQLYSDWKHIAVREMAALKGFRAEPRWIARKLGQGMSEKDAADSMKLLVTLGLLKRTANGLAPSEANITTADEVKSLLVKNYHRQMIHKGLASLEELPPSRRDVSSITIPIRSRDFVKVKEQLQLMRKEILNMGSNPGEGDEIVQVNIQLFPLTGFAE